MHNHAPFWGFLGKFELLKIVRRHPNPQKVHPWVTTGHDNKKVTKA